MSGAKQAGSYLNPAYLCTLRTTQIANTRSPNYMNIQGFLPEQLSFQLTANWDSLLKNFLGSGQGNGVIGAFQNIMHLLGTRTAYTQISSFPTWTGTEPLEFSIPFRFDAVSNTEDDVVKPWVSLMKVVCPTSESSGLLKAPGPQIIWDEYQKRPTFNEERVLSLKIGNFIYIRGVIVTGVSNTLYSKFDENGMPIAAQCDVSLRTTWSPTTEDIENWFACNSRYYQGTAIKNKLMEIVSNPVGFAGSLMKNAKDTAGYVAEVGKQAYTVGKDAYDQAVTSINTPTKPTTVNTIKSKSINISDVVKFARDVINQ